MTKALSNSDFAIHDSRMGRRNGDGRSPVRAVNLYDTLTNQAHQPRNVHPLDAEIARAKEAYQLMLVADTCLRSGAERLLLGLGFTQAHISDLRAQSNPDGGYPAYAMRAVRKTLRMLIRARQRDLDAAA